MTLFVMKNHSTERQKLDRDSLKRIGPRVLGFAKPHARTLLIGLLALALGSGINLLFPHLFRKILNNELGLTLTAHLPLILR